MKVNWQKTAEKYAGRWCVGGIDLSAVSDLTVWVMAFPDDKTPDLIDIIARVWCPESRLHDIKNKYRDQYQSWERTGFLTTTKGDAVDYDFVRARVVEDAKTFNIARIGVDMLFQGLGFANPLREELNAWGKDDIVVPCGMGYKTMTPACQEFERRMLKKQINHGGNPILRFCADNVSVVMDAAGGKKPTKAASQGKIDGIIGILICLDILLRLKPEPQYVVPSFI